jgi:uncharacterized protein YjbI with pentapeptide repeats
MNQDELNVILQKHKDWLDGSEGGKRADLRHADLRGADLRRAYLQDADLRDADLQGADMQGADLQYADLRSADLQSANLRSADLRYADLQSANLQYANLQYANLQYANLRGADLQDADLRYADLRYADLDYSCLPLWCGSKGMIVDRRIAAQIAAHFCALVCDDEDYQAARTAILEFAKTSYRAMDLGLLEEIVKECNDVATPIDVALRKRIAELEGKIDQLTAHSDIERQDDKWIPEVQE